MNKIAEGLLAEFRKEQLLPATMPKDTAFEHFAAFLTIGAQIEESLDTSLCVVGEDGQPGVDALGVVVNGALVTEIDEIETLADINGYLDVDFVVVQAKTSAAFETSALSDLGDFAERVFKTGCESVDNARVENFNTLKDFVYTQVKRFKRRNPNVYMYYVTTGQAPKGDKNFEIKEQLIANRLKSLNLFSEVRIALVGATELQRRYLQMSNSVTREISFPRKIALPDIPNVTQAFVGAVPMKEFLSLVEGENGNFISSIFYDNVRDWQGLNEVNRGMLGTLEDTERRARFVLMNNGVTVIAKKVIPTGEKVVLEDYQIVNGCQTSNVLWQARDKASADVLVPLRIVATTNDAVVADIISATNSQTAVSREQLLAATDFQKGLEQYFVSNSGNPLFYERRSRQFASRAVEKARVVTPLGLVKAFSSMFLEEPHKTARDFGSVLKKVPAEIFNDHHRFDPYFLAALAYFWVEYLLRKERIPKVLRSARYQLLLATRLFHEPEQLPNLSSKKVSAYVSKMLPLFKDAEAAEATFAVPVAILAKMMKGVGRDEPRTSSFTQSLKSAVAAARATA